MQHTGVIKNCPMQHHGDNDEEDAQNPAWCELGGQIAIITRGAETAVVGIFPQLGGGGSHRIPSF